MGTYQEKFYLEEATRWQRFKRNLRLIKYMLGIVWFWAVLGRKVRQQHRRSQANGETYWIDHLAGENK